MEEALSISCTAFLIISSESTYFRSFIAEALASTTVETSPGTRFSPSATIWRLALSVAISFASSSLSSEYPESPIFLQKRVMDAVENESDSPASSVMVFITTLSASLTM